MTTHLNELAPWEAKQRIINMGNSLEEISTQISSISRRNRVEQIKTSNAIIASQEKIAETVQSGFLHVSDSIDKLSNDLNYGLYDLKSSFEWGMSEIIWYIEQTNEHLKQILEVLKSPLSTQAQEYKERGLFAYKSNWFEDALLELEKAKEINKYDFTIHFTIGLIYHFHFIDKNKAIDNYKWALKYAKPSSDYYYSYVLLHLALAYSSIGNFLDAEKYSDEAMHTIENFAEAYYQNAQYNAFLGNKTKVIDNLKKAISIDHHYIIKASNDNIFKENKVDLNPLYIQFKEEEKTNAINTLEKYKNVYSQFIDLIENISNSNTYQKALSYLLKSINEFISKYDDLKQKFHRDSYYDYIDIGYSSNEFDNLLNGIKNESSRLLSINSFYKSPYNEEPIDIITHSYVTEKQKREKEISKILGKWNFPFAFSENGIGGVISFFVLIAFLSFLIKLFLWIWFPWQSPTFIIPFIILTIIFVFLVFNDSTQRAKYLQNKEKEESLKLTPLKKEYDYLIKFLKNRSVI